MISSTLLCFALIFGLSTFAQKEIIYDVVITGGRGDRSETKLDAIRNVGIIGGRVSQITAESLKGKETINATGLVVSPGL
jgi:N-acyl-D-aspartate/D-glutamate deacylase